MSAGSGLSLLSSGALNGVLLYHNVFPSVFLGQTSGVSFRNNFSLDEPERIRRAFLEVGLITQEPLIRGFIVSLNGITLTREFKPINCSPYGERLFCKAVYDVEPIVRAKPTSTWSLEIEYRGLREVMLAHVGLLVAREHESASSSHAYLSGALSLKPGESTALQLPSRLEEGAEARIVAVLPSSEARLVIEPVEAPGSGLQGSGLVEHAFRVPPGTDRITLRHVGGGSYYPRELVVSSLLIYRVKAPVPVIEVSLKSLEEGHAIIVVSNRGDADVGNVIVVSFSKGNVLERKILSSLKPGEEVEVKIRAEQGGSVRVIWRYLDRTLFREIKLR